MAHITLLSDFGLQDAAAAIAKGVIMQYAGNTPIIDITHEIQPFNKKQAAYLLGACYKNFPKGSIHVVFIDIFSGKTPTLVKCEYDGHYFLAPDNGLLPLMIKQGGYNAWKIMEITDQQFFHDWLHKTGQAIKSIVEKGLADDSLHAPVQLKNTDAPIKPNDVLNCEVVHVDTFGNAVLDADRTKIDEVIGIGRSFSLRFIHYEEIKEVSKNYSDVREGFKLCRFNSNDHLEICVNKGSAAHLFGLKIGSRHNNIQIIGK